LGSVLWQEISVPGMQVEESWKWCNIENSECQSGLSLEAGPKELYDFYRKDKGGHGTFDRIMRTARLLQKRKVEFNILRAVNRKNADHPLEVYRFFRDKLEVQYLQFIPIVEQENGSGYQEGNRVTDRSVLPAAVGSNLRNAMDESKRR